VIGTRTFRGGALLALLLASLVGASSVARGADVIERVVAVVNEEAIFLSAVRTRSAPFLAQLAAAPEAERPALIERLYGQVIDALIDEELLRQAARQMQVRVTTVDIDRAIENVRTQNNLSLDEFWQAVQQQGYTEAQYRDDLRRQLLRLKVINQRVRGRVNITEEDVRREYDRGARRANRRYRFHAAHIFVALPANPTATDVARVRGEIAALTDGITAERFDEVMGASGGGDLGWLSQGDLPAELENALLTLEPGAISAPVRGPSGYHVFLLRERDSASSEMASYDEVKEEIYRRMLDDAMTRQEAIFIAELRRDAVIVRHAE
jgi:peptidyl-prolyl cis-trans isomerase SurA